MIVGSDERERGAPDGHAPLYIVRAPVQLRVSAVPGGMTFRSSCARGMTS
jgi:hypothetical protein